MLHGQRIVGTVAYMGGVPAVLEQFAWAWGQMVQFNAEYLVAPGERVHYDRATVSYHSVARNALADRMRGDWIVMLDTDHGFEPDLIARLLRAADVHDLDVLSALYVYKQPPHNPVLFTRDGDAIRYLGDWDRTVTVMQVGGAGAGALFVRRRVFERMRTELNENPFEIRKCFSEDNSFFDRCWQLGIPCWCAPAIESPHLVVRSVTAADYRPTPDMIGPRRQVEGRR